MLRPGKFEITDKAMKICKIKKGGKVLEIGCGNGDTTEHLEKEYEYDVSAIDLDLDMISKAKARGLKANIKYGDGEFLEDFTSLSFDGVVIECVLSLINLPDEALHEVWCILKKGGKLFISDLYIKKPEKKLIEEVKMAAEKQAKTPHEDGSCSDDCAEDHKERIVEFRHEGRFLLAQLEEFLESIGFTVTYTEDRSKDLDNYVAEKIMNGETMEEGKKGTGYFMLIAEKTE